MLRPTSQTLLLESMDKKTKILNETSLFSKNTAKSQNIETVNTIKVDFSKMSKCPIKPSRYTQCQCGAIVTVHDQNK